MYETVYYMYEYIGKTNKTHLIKTMIDNPKLHQKPLLCQESNGHSLVLRNMPDDVVYLQK